MKKMIPLTIKESQSCHEQNTCHICKKEFSIYNKDKKISKDHCHHAAHNICNLRYKTRKEILVVFHNGSTCDYHFIGKELVKESEGQLECLGENTEKYITFLVPINKTGNGKTITYKIRFIDSIKSMSSSLSNLVSNLADFTVMNAQIVSLVLSTIQPEINY